MTLKAEKFEELLSREMTAALDPQRGKALAAFRAHMAEEAQRPQIAGSLKQERAKQISAREMWFWSSVPSVAAACLAVVVTLKVVGPVNQPTNTGAQMANVIVSPEVQQVERTTRQDGGVLVNNNVPMRVVTEQTTRETQWVDPRDHSVYKLIQPVENVNYERVQPF